MDQLLTRDKFLDHFKDYTIVAGRFKENKQGSKVNIRHNISLSMAESLNTIKDKWDIFFTPNGDYKKFFGENESKDQKGRSEKTVTDIGGNIYALIADNDLGEKIWKEVGLNPTIVVKTKHGYHMYFILKNPVSYKEYSKRFKSIEEKFITLLHADDKCRDIARILRIPGFSYWADNKGETIIEIEEYNEEEIYTFDEWENRINAVYNNICMDDTEKNQLKIQHKGRRMGKVLDETFDRIKNGIHALDVLEDLFPQFQGTQGGGINENGQKTRGYKWHPTLNYVNNFSNDDVDDRPRGGPWSIAKSKFKSLELILDYFKNRRGVDISDIRTELGSQKEVVFEDLTRNINMSEEDLGELIGSGSEPKGVFKYGTDVEGLIIDQIKCEIRGYNADTTDIPFISALIESVGKTNTDRGEKYIIRITKKGCTPIIDLLPTSGTNTEFRKFLQKYGIMIPDKDKFFVLLYQYIFKETRVYHTTNKLGLQLFDGKKILVTKAGTYVDEEKQIYVSIEDSGNDIIDVLDQEIDIKKYVDQLLSGYDGKISLPIFLSLLIGVNSYFFRSNGIQLPQVFVFGLSQAGKTCLLKNMFYSFGIKKDISALSKAFVYEKNAKHYIPTHFSEYRNGGHKQSEQIEGVMRNLFDGTPIEKGRADQTTVKYESNGLYIFDGQTIFTDDAAQTRMIILMANKKYQGSLTALRTLPNIYKYATNIFKDNEDFVSFIRLSEKKYETIKASISLLRSNDRMLTNYSYLYTLLDRIGMQEHTKYLDEAMLEQDGLTAQDDIQYIYQKMFNLQVICRFDTSIYKRGLIINIVEEGLKYNTTNINDLKGFVQTINANFLGPNSLPSLSTYVDFDYVYNNRTLHGAFCRMLNFVTIDSNGKTQEEKTTIMGLREFLKTNYPNHSIMQDINFEANYSSSKKQTGELTFE